MKSNMTKIILKNRSNIYNRYYYIFRFFKNNVDDKKNYNCSKYILRIRIVAAANKSGVL